uniref:Uncharacterized protein LOC104248562 n=1 Tax=Nicotiana sylvestris TaxID=4096 RepID=A0A1U7YVC8_NICSY
MAFLRMILMEYGMPTKFVELIMNCVSTVSYSLILNRGLTTKFQGKKGLRQRDPMSPYRFVLVMEYLNRALKKLKDNPDFNYHPKYGIHQLLMDRFNHFSEVSGLKANMEKSVLYIAGVTKEFKKMILEEMQFILGELPFKYLGVPLSSKKLTVQQCMPLIEKITSRINCWTAELLSYSGKLQLLKSVIFEMQTYWAHVFLVPKKILKLIISACRTFLWTGRGEPSRRALIAWDIVCIPFSAGGLNVLDIHIWNKAALCKLLWAVSAKKDTLWIHSYYIKGQDSMRMDTPKQACWLVRKIFDMRYWFLEKYTSVELH